MNEYTNLKLATNIPVTIEFLWDDAKRWEHAEYGVSYTANVRAEWSDRTGDHVEEKASLRMTPKLFSELIDLGVGKGSIIAICKETTDTNKTIYTYEVAANAPDAGLFVKNRERQMVDLDGKEIGRKVVQGNGTGSPTVTSAPAAKQQNTSGLGPSPNWVEVLDQQQALYEEGLSRAFGIWHRFNTETYPETEDVRTLLDSQVLHASATTLAIAADRKGVRVPTPAEADDEKEGQAEETKDDLEAADGAAPPWEGEEKPPMPNENDDLPF